MSHASEADKLLIKPAAGARPAPPHTRGQIIPKARTKRPVTRRVTHGTATTRPATPSDRPARRVLPSPERATSRRTSHSPAGEERPQVIQDVEEPVAAKQRFGRRLST